MDNWKYISGFIEPLVVKIDASRVGGGCGTGFVIKTLPNTVFVATARHVCPNKDAVKFQPASTTNKIDIDVSNGIMKLGDGFVEEVFPDPDPSKDICILQIFNPTNNFSGLLIPSLLAPKAGLLRATEVGMLGYAYHNGLWFTHGYISNWMSGENRHYIDGNCYNGMSGGPTFSIIDNQITYVGVTVAFNRHQDNDGIYRSGFTIAEEINHLLSAVTKLSFT